jgi:hypothetical protein
MTTAAAGIVKRQTAKFCKDAIEKKQFVGCRSRFISTAASGPPPFVRMRDTELVNWDNFDRGTWPENTENLPFFKFLMTRKRKNEAKLLAAQQERSTQYPNKEPYNLRETHACRRVIEMRDAELFWKVAANVAALTCVMKTAPEHIHLKFLKKQRRLAQDYGMLITEVNRLYTIRQPLVLFDYLPLWAELQVHTYHQRQQQERIERDPKLKGVYADQKQKDPEPVRAGKYVPTPSLNLISSGPSFSTHPELYAITPLSASIRIVIGRAQVVRDLRKLFDRSLRSTEQYQKASALFGEFADNINAILDLDRELRTLGLYSIQHYPGSMLGGRVELGKELWAKLEEDKHTRARQPK